MFKSRLTVLSFIFCLSFVFGSISESVAQQQPIVNFRNRGAQYQIGTEDELLIKVNIWGFVLKPGQYLVPSDTDLISLISFAGGPTENAQTKSIKLIRTIDYDSSGNNNDEQNKIYKFNVKKFLETGDEEMNPQLMPGDTIVVSGSTVHWISKVVQFVSQFTFLAQMWWWISIAQNR